MARKFSIILYRYNLSADCSISFKKIVTEFYVTADDSTIV